MGVAICRINFDSDNRVSATTYSGRHGNFGPAKPFRESQVSDDE